jgi:glycosyltransferase involved in cell wall biosynthesis
VTILLVSPFIDSEAVGEPRWCYDLARAISARTSTIIIAQTPRNRDYRIADLFPDAEVHEHPAWQMDWVPKRAHALFKPNYARFYRAAKRVIAHELDPAAIRCAHHFGPLGLRFPTPLQDGGIPYVMGPLGGSLKTPPGFTSDGGRQPWYYALRDLDGMRFRHDPWLRDSYRRAACLVGVAPYVRDVLADVPLQRFETWPEIAARPPAADLAPVIAGRHERPGPVRFLIVSRLIFSKGIHYALRAAATLPATPEWHIDVLGDGPMRPMLEEMIGALGLTGRVTLHGHVPRAQVDDFYRDADVFLFPSIREPSGAVVFEAMSWGLPMIAADYGGPAEHVRDAFGIRVPVTDQTVFENGVADAMRQLTGSADRRRAMGLEAARSARDDNSMEAMADYFLDLYDRVGRQPEAMR